MEDCVMVTSCKLRIRRSTFIVLYVLIAGVLYSLFNIYQQEIETSVAAEFQSVHRHGVVVGVWTHRLGGAAYTIRSDGQPDLRVPHSALSRKELGNRVMIGDSFIVDGPHDQIVVITKRDSIVIRDTIQLRRFLNGQ
jgi:hypothetical protein